MVRNPEKIELTKIISLDLETTGLQAWEESIDLIAIKTEKEGYVIEVDEYDKEWLIKLFQRISKECDVVIIHNAKFDVGFIWSHFKVMLTNIHCTMTSAEICENGKQKDLKKIYPKKKQGPFSLVSVLHRWLGIVHANAEDKDIMRDSFIDKKLRPFYKSMKHIRRKQINYAYEDVEHLHKLYQKQLVKIDELDLETVYKLEHKLLPVLVRMEIKGCLIDKANWKNLIDNHWKPEALALQTKLDLEVKRLLGDKKLQYHTDRGSQTLVQFGMFGDNELIEDENELNYGSQDHLVELFKLIKCKLPKNEDDESSFEEGCISVYLTENPESKVSKFLELLLEYRKINKLVTTYGYKFLSKLDRNSHIHTSYSQTQTETGRLSSRSPNLQNIPAAPKNDPNKDIRRFFLAPKGYKFITSDMEGAEVRIAADYSQEPLLLDSIRAGVDMHSKLASISYSLIFNKPITISKKEAEDPEMFNYSPGELRDTHKSVVFAKFYKGGAARVYGVLAEFINKHCSSKDRKNISQQISDALDLEMPVLSNYLSSLIHMANKDGYLRGSVFNRIRFFRPNAYGEAANFPVQNTNSEAIKMAMINLDKKLAGLDAWIVLNVHDELCVVAEDSIAEPVAVILKEVMADSLSYFLKTIKGGASVSISTHWKK